jgi:hypothetical protein
MKRAILFGLLLLLAGGIGFSQVDDYQRLYRFLELSEEEIEWFADFQTEIDLSKREAQLELNLVRAQLEKLLFPVNANMREVEKLLRSSVEWRLQIELAEIRWRVESRKKLGEEKYQKLLRFMKMAALQKQKAAAAGKERTPAPPQERNPAQGK